MPAPVQPPAGMPPSNTVTVHPSPCSRSAMADPTMPAPTTRTFLPTCPPHLPSSRRRSARVARGDQGPVPFQGGFPPRAEAAGVQSTRPGRFADLSLS